MTDNLATNDGRASAPGNEINRCNRNANVNNDGNNMILDSMDDEVEENYQSAIKIDCFNPSVCYHTLVI